MGLLSFFKRQAGSPVGAPKGAPSGTANSAVESSDAVLRARTRARQRLIGAAVLLVIGIIGFPLVFETQPRPIPVNIPIVAPGKDNVPALTMPAARTPGNATPASAVVAAAVATPSNASPPKASAPAEAVITESSDDAGREVALPPTASADKPAAVKPAGPMSKPVAEPKRVAEPKAAAEPKPAPNDAARVEALLDGKPAQAAKPDKPEKGDNANADASGRLVVQLGAFADNAAAHGVRMKAEKLGIKTYAQVVNTSAGKRYRVRIGPFASRDEADKALAKAKSAGLAAAVMPL